jgi:peptidoglycan hydrolase-like protein with peptidoglycan-binding domain
MSNMNRVLNFESYHKIFEAEEANVSASAAEQIVGLFYQAYGSMVTKIGDYKDAIDDLLQVAEEKDVTKKGDVMESVLKKVVAKINPEYKSVGNTVLEAGKKLKDAYTTLLETEEGKKSTEEINKVIYRKILEFQKGLQTASKEMPKVEVKAIEPIKTEGKEGKDNNSENYEYFEDDINEGLFSKNTFGEERNTIISSLVIFYSDMVAQAKNGATDAIKSKAQEVANNLKKLNDTLGDEKAWEDMKRRERKDKLEEIPATIAGYKEDFNKTLMAESTKMGIDKKVSAAISEVIKLLDGVAATVAEVDKKVAKASVVKSEEKEKDKKNDTTSYIEIASGNVKKHNLSKKGPNLDKIKKFQENYVALKLSPEIKADGLYGKNTEAAILKAAQMLDGLTGSDLAKATDSGKKMTPEVQAGLQKFLDNKDKIKDLIK